MSGYAPISIVCAKFLIASLWQCSLLALAGWALLEALPPLAGKLSMDSRMLPSALPSKTRFLLWMAVFLCIAALPFAAPLFHRQLLTPGAQAIAPIELPSIWAAALTALWAVFAAIALARLLTSAAGLYRLRRNAKPLSPERLDPTLRSSLKRGRPIALLTSNLTDGPLVIGFFRPAIVLPDWLPSKASDAEMNQIVTHELAHLKRGDDWTNLFERLLCALFPLNLALLWAGRRLQREREMACDDVVLNSQIRPKDYAACLVGLAEMRMRRRAHALAPGAWKHRSELALRVYRILSFPSPAFAGQGGRGAGLLTASLAIVLFSAGAKMARCPEWIGFDSPSPGVAADASLLRSAASLVPPKSIDSSSAPRIVEASYHLPASRKDAPAFARSRPATPNLAPLALPVRHARRARPLASPSLTPAQKRLISQPAATSAQPQVVFTVWEVSFSQIPADSWLSGRLAAVQSRSGWIVFRL